MPMTPDTPNRRLAAILSADVVGYSRLMAEDEAAIHSHAELSGFPASKITAIKRQIDPTTASCA